MEKKLLYIRSSNIRSKLFELARVCESVNELYLLLQKFGINDYKAVYDTNNEVDKFIREKMKNMDIPFNNFLKLINKDEEYKAIINLCSKISGYKHMNLISFLNNSFFVLSSAEKTFREILTPYVTNPKEIQLVTRIEDLITEAFLISNLLGIHLERSDNILKTFRAYQEDGKILVDPGDFLKRIK